MAFDKLKRFVGIGTLEVVLVGPESVELKSGTLTAVAQVTAKSDCEVSSAEFRFTHETEEDRNNDGNYTPHSKTLGRAKIPGFTIKSGESTTISAELNFRPQDLGMFDEKLREKGGLLGKIGEMGLLTGGNGSYEVDVTVDVVGAANDPDDSRTVRIS